MKAKTMEYSNSEIARKLGITEGAVRYRLKRAASNRSDGRSQKISGLGKYHEVISVWLEEQHGTRHHPTLKLLYETLVTYHNCRHSYDALRRYVRKYFPELVKKGAKIRLETPPGKLIQVDWKEDVLVQIGNHGNWVRVHALFLILGFSRKTAVIFSERKDLASFIHCHQEGFRQLGKGKVEKKIRDVFGRLDISHRVYSNMLELQQTASQKLAELETQWRCGATGLSVKESFDYETDHLKSLPGSFPRIPVRESYLRVRDDSTVCFGSNFYQLKRKYIGKTVLCINNGQEILIYYNGEELERYAYLPGSRGMVNLSEKALQALNDDEFNIVVSGKVLSWGLEVARRQVSIYNDITANKMLGGMSA
jgi:hypothetical protein